VIDIVRFRGGQMVEHWAVIDIFGLFMQLGAIPSPD
jgi:predicted SnoaL-like aldol condensation-catalyzing enzyme